MAKGIGHFILIIKAILTRIIFATHGFVAIWRVTTIKNDPYYWYLCASILALAMEGVFTLTIKENQEWKWFCPSVFFYLCSVVPAIWLLEVDKFDRKLALRAQAAANITAIISANEELAGLPGLDTFGVEVKLPVKLDSETWAMVIEQLLMLILIIGRWMLPKGGLTRDQLSQLLLVYIGTAADIIEFFDSFKDDKIASQRILCLLILSIWSWSLLQFTFVLTATKSRRTRLTADIDPPKPKFVNGIYKVKEVCCSIDVWGILINIILQDAPFLVFRMLLITYYEIISYMNIFFTCKNTLVIILQFYRLYVVQQEKNKEISKLVKANTVSGNLAKAVERAAFMGPTADPKIKGSRPSANSKRGGGGGTAGPSSKKVAHPHPPPKKHRSQDSITSQNTNARILEAARRERAKTGRRKSLSTGNLPEAGEENFENENPTFAEDDVETGMSGSVLSGTNDQDSQGEDSEAEAPLDDVSIESERPPKINKKIRMSENPGIYKISGSRSSAASSEQGQGRYRQDTGYSSSSKDSANSNNRRGRTANGGARSGRVSGGSRSRSAAQRRQMIIAKELNSIEYGGIMEDAGMDMANSSQDTENERIFQRRAAIGMVFFLFIVIFILCMIAIYGGINPKGLVLRETFSVRNSTRPRTTTVPPSSTEPPTPTSLPGSVLSPPILVFSDNKTNTSSSTKSSKPFQTTTDTTSFIDENDTNFSQIGNSTNSNDSVNIYKNSNNVTTTPLIDVTTGYDDTTTNSVSLTSLGDNWSTIGSNADSTILKKSIITRTSTDGTAIDATPLKFPSTPESLLLRHARHKTRRLYKLLTHRELFSRHKSNSL